MAILTDSQRKDIPKSKVGLPSKVTKKGGAVTGSYPIPDKKHAALAKAYATRFANPAQKKQIDSKANKMLGKGAMVTSALKKRIGK